MTQVFQKPSHFALVAVIGSALILSSVLPILAQESKANRTREEVSRSFYDLINGGDVAAWRENLAEGWTAVPALSADDNHVAGYEGTIAAFRAGFPDLNVEQVEVIQNADVVAVRSIVTGTNTAELFGRPATGKPISITAMDIHRIENGQIVETWHVEDFTEMERQLSGE